MIGDDDDKIISFVMFTLKKHMDKRCIAKNAHKVDFLNLEREE